MKKLINELKEMINDLKNICREEGVLIGSLYTTLFIIVVILSIPFMPIYLLNEWSKSWFE